MRVQVGSGAEVLPGFVNVEPRPLGARARKGHAADLGFAGNESVDVLFSNAVFEHLYLGQQIGALREWRRVLAPDGVVVCIGIPDFEVIARLYLDGATPGSVSERFDLFEVYRYTHGEPEQGTHVNWSRWQPDRHLNRAPHEWLPQLHKSLFDAPTLSGLFDAAGLQAAVIRYCHPSDTYRLNLGAIAGHAPPNIDDALARIPGIERFLVLSTVERLEVAPDVGGIAKRAVFESEARVGALHRAARQARRSYRSIRALGTRRRHELSDHRNN
jgi:hypothetical protein